MKSVRLKLVTIFLAAFFATWISFPNQWPLSVHLGPINFETTLRRPVLTIPGFINGFGSQWRLHTGLDIQGGSQIVFQADMTQIPEVDRTTALEATRNNIERRVNLFGVSEPTVQTALTADQYRIIVELPGVSDVSQAISIIGQTAQLEFYQPTTATDSAIPFEPSGLTGKNLTRAQADFDPQTGQPVVKIVFDTEGTQKFADLTTKFVGQQIPIMLDGFPISSPIVNEPILSGEGIISGNFTTEGAKQTAIQLNAGALPVPIQIVRQQNIGATLGEQSVQQSVRAGLIGLAAVMIFMLLNYGRFGLISDVTLIVYGLITLAMYKLTGITLTLPGITGFILSVGMAVDANILIFERFKEEYRLNRPFGLAMELAFGRAWDSIRDANICTIITCILLYTFTSGSVRGFAVTLGIGIAISLFTGIIVTRNLIRAFIKPPKKSV